MEPNGLGAVRPIPTPTIAARAIVSMKLTLASSTPQGNSCILTLANDRNAIQVRGNGDIHANCGLLIDGGRDQNANEAPQTCSDGTAPPCGGLTLQGANARVHISNLTVAATTAGPAEESCPDPTRCFLYNPTTSVLPASQIFTSVATPDPFAGRAFTKPGVVITGFTTVNTGANYTKGARTFTVQGGTGIPAKFTASVSSGKISSVPVLTDPGSYTALPASPVSVIADDGKGAGATFAITSGNCLPNAKFPTIPVPGRAYCSISLSGGNNVVNFPTGIYYAEGGETGCVGLCFGAGTYSTDAAGVTFVLTKCDNAPGVVPCTSTVAYAQMAVSGNNSLNFTAPPTNINADGSACAANCPNTTFGMIVFQDRNAPETTALSNAGAVTSSNPLAGTTLNSMSGCGNNPLCRTLSGTLYFPKQTFNFSGNGQVQGTCFGLVAKYLDDAGVPIFQNGCLPGTTGGGGGSGNVIGGTLRLAQ
jgi:hypothetical protein